MMRATLVLVLVLLNALAFATGEQIPQSAGPVTDLAQVFSAAEAGRITRMRAEYEAQTSHQLAVLTVTTLQGESIESFSRRVAGAWGLGRSGVNNGIVVTLAMRERAARIELGRGFEPYISDARAQQIMDESMIPAFRRGKFAEGVENGLVELMSDGRKFVVPPGRTRKRAPPDR